MAQHTPCRCGPYNKCKISTYSEHGKGVQCAAACYRAVFVLDVLSLSKGIRVQTLPTTQRRMLIHFLQTGHIGTLIHNQI